MSNKHYNLYETLGLRREASSEELTAELSRRLAELRGQGKPEGSPEVDEAATALRILGDAGRRRAYDTRLDDPEAPTIDIPALKEIADAAGAGDRPTGAARHSAGEPEGGAAEDPEKTTNLGGRQREHADNGPKPGNAGARREEETRGPGAGASHPVGGPGDGQGPGGPRGPQDNHDNQGPQGGQRQGPAGGWHGQPSPGQPAFGGPQGPAGPGGPQGPRGPVAGSWWSGPQEPQPQRQGAPAYQRAQGQPDFGFTGAPSSTKRLIDAPQRDLTAKGAFAQLPKLPKFSAFLALFAAVLFFLAALVSPFIGAAVVAHEINSAASAAAGPVGDLFGLDFSGIGSQFGAMVLVALVPLAFLINAVLAFQALAAVGVILRRGGAAFNLLLVASYAVVALGGLVALFTLPFGIGWTALVVFAYAVAMIVLLSLPESQAWAQGKLIDQSAQSPNQFGQGLPGALGRQDYGQQGFGHVGQQGSGQPEFGRQGFDNNGQQHGQQGFGDPGQQGYGNGQSQPYQQGGQQGF